MGKRQSLNCRAIGGALPLTACSSLEIRIDVTALRRYNWYPVIHTLREHPKPVSPKSKTPLSREGEGLGVRAFVAISIYLKCTIMRR